MTRALALAVAALLLAAACVGGSDDLVGQEVVSEIPWAGAEAARYRLMDGDELKGSGVLTIEPRDGELVLRQEFQGGGFTDRATAVVDAATMRPRRVERVIEGPKGRRECLATYSSGLAVVEQRSAKDERRDELDVPSPSYDSWTDIFLWRTLSFDTGFRATYVDVLTCTLARPQLTSVTLEVAGKEEVVVPAGSFQAWRLEIRSKGQTQKAWFADAPGRPLVRYDNGSLIFELLSLE